MLPLGTVANSITSTTKVKKSSSSHAQIQHINPDSADEEKEEDLEIPVRMRTLNRISKRRPGCTVLDTSDEEGKLFLPSVWYLVLHI